MFSDFFHSFITSTFVYLQHDCKHTCFGQLWLTRCPEVDGAFRVHKQLVVARDEACKITGIGPFHE